MCSRLSQARPVRRRRAGDHQAIVALAGAVAELGPEAVIVNSQRLPGNSSSRALLAVAGAPRVLPGVDRQLMRAMQTSRL